MVIGKYFSNDEFDLHAGRRKYQGSTPRPFLQNHFTTVWINVNSKDNANKNMILFELRTIVEHFQPTYIFRRLNNANVQKIEEEHGTSLQAYTTP